MVGDDAGGILHLAQVAGAVVARGGGHADEDGAGPAHGVGARGHAEAPGVEVPDEQVGDAGFVVDGFARGQARGGAGVGVGAHHGPAQFGEAEGDGQAHAPEAEHADGEVGGHAVPARRRSHASRSSATGVRKSSFRSSQGLMRLI